MFVIKRKSRPLKDVGSSPGSLVYTGHFTAENTKVDAIIYSSKEVEELKDISLEKIKLLSKNKTSVVWINICGLNNLKLIREIGAHFNLDSLTLEDILSVRQRPKVEEYDEYVYLVLKMLRQNKVENNIDLEQLSIIVKDNTVITFQEREEDVFDSVRKRIMNPNLPIRTRGSDYLIYALVDTIVDNYFIVLEMFDTHIDHLDKDLESDSPDLAKKIFSLRGDLLHLRRYIYPIREVVNELTKTELKIFSNKTTKYLRDLYDHTITINENLDSLRELLTDQLSIFHTNMNNKMNETMKVLTIIATIFIPLSFITGLYGMNFTHMPELEWKYGYYMVWAIIVVLGLGMVMFFRKRKWI